MSAEEESVVAWRIFRLLRTPSSLEWFVSENWKREQYVRCKIRACLNGSLWKLTPSDSWCARLFCSTLHWKPLLSDGASQCPPQSIYYASRGIGNYEKSMGSIIVIQSNTLMVYTVNLLKQRKLLWCPSF